MTAGWKAAWATFLVSTTHALVLQPKASRETSAAADDGVLGPASGGLQPAGYTIDCGSGQYVCNGVGGGGGMRSHFWPQGWDTKDGGAYSDCVELARSVPSSTDYVWVTKEWCGLLFADTGACRTYCIDWCTNHNASSCEHPSLGMTSYCSAVCNRPIFSAADTNPGGDCQPLNYEFLVCSTAQAPTTAPTPAPTPSPTSVASATGDPHLQNVHGERFDLMKPGNHLLINIPKGESATNAMLRVEAQAKRVGGCSELYFQSLNITGTWAEQQQTGGYRYNVSQPDVEHSEWIAFHTVELKVIRGHTQSGFEYLNFFVKHLGRAGLAVGGLLGDDDHSDAMTDTSCRKRSIALEKGAPSTMASQGQSPSMMSSAEASYL